MTPFTKKCEILSDLWLNYRDDETFADFIDYCDLGFPLAYAIANSIVEKTDRAENLVDETWDLFLEMLEAEDTGYSNLDELLADLSEE